MISQNAFEPTVVVHDGIHVVRDDLHPGGTKARYFIDLFEQHDHVVYASPCEGGAQTALAWAAREAGKRCTIFVAQRKQPHSRSLLAKRFGADVIQVPHGYLNVVQSKSREFCRRTGAYEMPFGAAMPGAIERLGHIARALPVQPAEVWCAGGSGTLAKALMFAWPDAAHNVVQVGRDLTHLGTGVRYRVHTIDQPFSKPCRAEVPFPSDPHYDRKAWVECRRKCARDGSIIVFWNVTGPAEETAA